MVSFLQVLGYIIFIGAVFTILFEVILPRLKNINHQKPAPAILVGHSNQHDRKRRSLIIENQSKLSNKAKEVVEIKQAQKLAKLEEEVKSLNLRGKGHSLHEASSSEPPRYIPPEDEATRNRRIMTEQDNEYLASLEADRKKEKEKESLEKLEKERQEHIQHIQATLPEEPAAHIEGVTTLQIRLPSGKKFRRRFLGTDKLQVVINFLTSKDIIKEKYHLVSGFPKIVLKDSNKTLTEYSLVPNASLFVEIL